MADKASIVGSDDKGQFSIAVPRSSIDRVDVIDIDMVLHTKSGERLILPGAALEAMTAAPPAIRFSDGIMGADGLLSSVDRVQTPSTSIPAMTSLTQFDQKKTEGKKNRTDDGKDKANEAAQQAQSQQVAPLPAGSESSVDKLIAKAMDLEADLRKKAFDPAPPQVYQSPQVNPSLPTPQPPTTKIPLYVSLSLGNYVDAHTDTDLATGVKTVYGAGGPSQTNIASGVLTGDAGQYGTETLSGGSAGDVFYADGFHKASGNWSATSAPLLNGPAAYAALDKETGLAPNGTSFYYAKEISLNVAGYLYKNGLYSVSVSGLPSGVSIEGATALGNGTFSIDPKLVVPDSKTLVLVYDVASMRALFNADSDGDGVNDYVDIKMVITLNARTTEVVTITKTFLLRFQDVDGTDDVTSTSPVFVQGKGGGWTDIYVMPTASAPHLILTNTDTYDTNLSFAQNAAATSTTADGANTVYAGNSADTILAGAGDDTIYAYAGNDLISGGNGNNLIWAGDGNDTVITGTGNDVIHAGRGNNTITDGGGNNTIDVLTTKTVNGTVVSGNGKDVVTITGDGNNTITVGDETDAYADGDDTVTTANGLDTIHVGDGNNVVTTGNGNKTIYAGDGADTITTGSGDDTITTGDGANIVNAGDGNNIITAGGGNDTLVGGAGADSIVAGGGDDWIYGGTGANVTLDGGSGTDWLSFNGIGASVTGGGTTLADWLTNAGTITSVTLNTVNASGVGTLTHTGAGTETDAIGNIENFIGSGGNDVLNLSGYTGVKHILYGLGGNDVLTGSDMDDTLYGGAGNDSLIGNAGNDVIFTSITSIQATIGATALAGTGVDALADTAGLSYTSSTGITITGQHNVVDGGAGADTIVGGAGNDYFVSGNNQYSDTTTGAYDTFIGGGGIDTVDHSSFTANLVIDLSNGLGRINGGAYIASYSSIERILTGSGNDAITGSVNDEIIYAGNGTNTISVGGGTDSAFGGTGTDYFYSVAGATSSRGGANVANIAYYDGGGGYNEYYLRAGTETINGTSGTDRIFYNNSAATTLGGVTYGVFVNLDGTNWVVSNSGALTTTAGTSYWYNGTAWVTAMTGDTSNSGLHGFYGDAAGDTYMGTIEQIYGTSYNDVLIGNSAGNWFFGAGGSDAMYGLGGADTFVMMYGGTSNSGADYINGGNDVLNTADSYTISANGNGTLSTTGGDLIDFSSGNAINRSLVINLDTVSHNDTATGTGTSYAANQISGWFNTVTVVDVERATGGNYADIIYGSGADNVLNGGAGNDSLWGYDGNDFLIGGTGSNYLNGGNGNDWASYYGLGVGVEVYLADADLDGNGTNDQAGDAANWQSSTQARAVGQNGYDYDRLVSIENIEGTDYADRIAGDSNDNSLFGGQGNDTIFGGAGNDVIDGGSGNDTIEGGSGADTLTGGAGTDLLSYASSSAGVTVNLGANTATGGDATGDVISGFEYLRGSAHDDTLTGSNGVNNIIYGGAGNDTLVGTSSAGGGNYDTLYGDAGSDIISLTVAQLATTYVYGGSGNAAGNATETGTDRLFISNNANLTSLNANLIHSIEVIDLANGSTQDVSAFQAAGSTANARALINGILDNAGNTNLVLYLDNNDRFHTGYSDGNGAGSYVSGSNSQATYTYSGSSITVHWGSG